MYGGVRWEYCLEEWGAKSYFWGVLSKGVRRDIIGVSIELLYLYCFVNIHDFLPVYVRKGKLNYELLK